MQPEEVILVPVPMASILGAQTVVLLDDIAVGWCCSGAEEECAARQGGRLAFDNGLGAALRRHGPDKSPAPQVAGVPAIYDFRFSIGDSVFPMILKRAVESPSFIPEDLTADVRR